MKMVRAGSRMGNCNVAVSWFVLDDSTQLCVSIKKKSVAFGKWNIVFSRWVNRFASSRR